MLKVKWLSKYFCKNPWTNKHPVILRIWPWITLSVKMMNRKYFKYFFSTASNAPVKVRLKINSKLVMHFIGMAIRIKKSALIPQIFGPWIRNLNCGFGLLFFGDSIFISEAIYNYLCPSVCPYVCLSVCLSGFWENAIFAT